MWVFTQVAHDKRETVIELLRSLTKNEPQWVIGSGRSPKMSKWANHSFYNFFLANRSFAHFAQKTSDSPRKVIREFPNLCHSLQKSNMSDLLSSLFKKEQCEWFAHDLSRLLAKKQAIHSKILYFLYVLTVFPLFSLRANRSHHSFLICSFKKSHLSDLLPSLFVKKQPWVIRSGCSWQKSDCEQFTQVAHDNRATGAIHTFSWANGSFPLLLTKN